MTTERENRRRFSRIEFDAESILYAGDREIPVSLVDISLRGALVTLDAPDTEMPAQDLLLEVLLAGHEQSIKMQCELAHSSAGQLGLKCMHIDVDSASHLRRLVELNLGDPDLLDRELAQLV